MVELDWTGAHPAIRDLLRDNRGYPIPYFIATLPNGERDFRIGSGIKAKICIHEHRCWVCGTNLGRLRCFIGGPLSVWNRVFGDAWMHPGCAEFSMRNCPHLLGRAVKRREAGLPPEAMAQEGFVADRPPFAGQYFTTSRAVILRSHGGLIEAGPSTKVVWWKDGRVVEEAEIVDELAAWRSKYLSQVE